MDAQPERLMPAGGQIERAAQRGQGIGPESGLRALVGEVRERGIRSIAVPPLGCGLGGLDWQDVRKSRTAEDSTPIFLMPNSEGTNTDSKLLNILRLSEHWWETDDVY